MNGVDISGGTSPKRQLLSTTDSDLNNQLNYIYNYDHDFITKEIIYKSFNSKEPILSPKIPIKFNKNFNNKTLNLIRNYKIDDSIKIDPLSTEKEDLNKDNVYVIPSMR